jgi:hypothetical protein
MRDWLTTMERALAREERGTVRGVLHAAVPDFQGAAA